MSKVISINDTSVTNNITYYRVSVRIPLRQLSVTRRYSEFDDLLKQLSYDLGIDIKEFPYQLPPKSSIFTKNASTTVEERKKGLESFLNQLVNDRETQNLPTLHDFLQLPVKFQFTSNLLKDKSDDITDLIIGDGNDIDSIKWLEYLRLFKSHVNRFISKFNEDPSVNNKLYIRDKIRQIIRPNLTKLFQRLESLGVEEGEYNRRKLLIKELDHELTALNQIVDHQQSSNLKMPGSFESSDSSTLLKGGRRVFGKQPQETNETLPLNNQELLQHQIQIHKDQDQELEQLRKIVARQKEIGLTINQEVEEQNELLDSLNEQVDSTTDKLRLGRKKAKQIL